MSDHIPYLSLSEVVKEYCLASYNDKRKYYINLMVHAKWIWKDLFLKSLFVVQNKYVKVDKSTNPYSIVLPPNMMRFINLSTPDNNGDLRSFVFDDLINDVPLPTGEECNQCNETNDYGSCINNITAVTKAVMINNISYVEKTWKKLCPNGDLLEITEKPTVDVNASGQTIVTMLPQQRFICNLEVKKCGCVKKTRANKDRIMSCCGGLIPENLLRMSQPTISKVGTKQGQIKISQGRIWVTGNVPDYLILSFQTNGVCAENEIMVPEYAVNPLMFGVRWRAMAFAPNKGGNEVANARVDYDRAVGEMDMFLNPIRVEEFMNVQMILPKWGSTVNQSFMKESSWFHGEDIACLPDVGGCSINQMGELYENTKNEVSLISNYTTDNNGHRVYLQNGFKMQWLLIHNLGYNPEVITTDLEGNVIDAEITYPNDGTSVLIKFSSPLKGKAILI